MRVVGSYLGAASISAAVAVTLLMWGHVDPATPTGPLRVPDFVVAWSPDTSIRLRRVATFLASAGPEVTVPLRVLAATLLFLLLDVVALVLYETTDDAWRGVAVWEGPKPLWAALIFTVLTSAIYMAALDWQIALIPRLGLPPSGFAAAALAGGLFFGLGCQRREPIEE